MLNWLKCFWLDHEWIHVGTYANIGFSGFKLRKVYQCKRCGKIENRYL